jgi:hypothetical protein
MVQRYEIELKGMIERYDGIDLLAQHFAEDIKTSANNERSVQCNQIKRCWLSKINPEFRLAENILETELDADPDQPPRVSPNLKGTVETVKDLQKLVVSPKMYSNFVLYDLLCAGLESGYFRGSHLRSCSNIAKLITPAHEAHFRTELWFALSKKSFRHNSFKKGNKIRVKQFKELCVAVAEGRKTYLLDAIAHRKQGLKDDNLEAEDIDENYSSDDAVTLNDDMLN